MINEEIIELLKRQFFLIMQQDEELKNINLSLSNEQQFTKLKDKSRNTIYIVVKFLEGTLNYKEKLLPITITAITEQNRFELCQKLLSLFADTYNLWSNDEGTITQTYASPVITSNFVEIYEGYRNVIQMSGMFLVTEKANSFKLFYTNSNNEEIEVETITNTFSYDNTLDTQPYFNSKNMTKSTAKFGTITINITLYLVDNEMLNNVLKIAFKLISNDTKFKFKLVHNNGLELQEEFRLVNYTSEKALGQLQVCSLTFTM